MLRINLLPPYIYAGKKKNKFYALWIVILALVVGGSVYWWKALDSQAAANDAKAQELEPRAKQADDMAAQAKKINDESAGIMEKATFVRDARKHTEQTYPTVVYNVRDYTLRTVLYSSLDPQGQSVAMNAYAPSLADVGHYMMWMERNPEISKVNVALNGLPQFPVPAGFGGNQGQGSTGPRPAGARGYDFGVTLTLMKPIASAPGYKTGGGGQSSAGGGMGPMGGMPMGSGMMGPGAMGPGAMGPGGMRTGGAAGGGSKSDDK